MGIAPQPYSENLVRLDGNQAAQRIALSINNVNNTADVDKPISTAMQSALDAKAALSHTHGNITNVGAIGSTANLPLITGASGVIQVGSFGTTASTFCQGNDSRLSDARTPTAHVHSASDITTGTLDNARLSAQVARTDTAAIFTSTVSSNTEFRLSNLSFSRVAQMDSDAGWGGGYNFNVNGDASRRDSTGTVSAIRFRPTRIEVFSETSGSPGVITPKYIFEPTLATFTTSLQVNGSLNITGNATFLGEFTSNLTKLTGFTTATLPAASAWAGSITYDLTIQKLVGSNGTTWNPLW